MVHVGMHTVRPGSVKNLTRMWHGKYPIKIFCKLNYYLRALATAGVPVGIELNMDAAAPLGMRAPVNYSSVRVPTKDLPAWVTKPNAHPTTPDMKPFIRVI